MNNKNFIIIILVINSFISVFAYLINESFLIEHHILFSFLNVFLFFEVSLFFIIKGKKNIFSLFNLFIVFQFLIQTIFGNIFLYFDVSDYNAGSYYITKSLIITMISFSAILLVDLSNKFERIGKKINLKFASNSKFNYRVKFKPLLFFYFISVLFYIFALNLGIFGYASSSTLENTERFASISQYILYFVYLNRLLLFVSFIYFLVTKTNKYLITFIIFFLISLVLSIISGMKIELISILISLGLLFYIYRRKISKFILISFGLVIGVTYSVINDVRTIMRTYNFTRFEAITNYFNGSATVIQNTETSTILSVLQRVNIIESMSAIIRYKDEIGVQTSDPSFLLDFILTPITTFIPRLLLPIKSMHNYGLWVTQIVHQKPNIYSSSYITLQGFFYLGGGLLLVLLGFYAIGVVLKITDGIIDFKERNILTIPIYTVLLYQVILEPSNPVSFFTDIARSIIIFYIFMRIITKRYKKT